jgi:hypothetical protein
MWALAVLGIWTAAAALVGVAIGLVVRHRDLPEARRLRALHEATVTPLRPAKVEGRLAQDRPATYA